MRGLRRDLLVDVLVAILLTVLTLSMAAGLGVIALLEVPVATVVIGSFVWERRARAHRRATRPPA